MSSKKQRKGIERLVNMKEKKYTLEKHLHKLAEFDNGNKSLESVYDLQKRKLERYMSSVVTTFPTYSTHDTMHSVNIIAAIEKILGKRRIKALSAIDTFLILMCAYMHDIGMLYTDREVRAIWNSAQFQEFLKNCENGREDISTASKIVRGKLSDIEQVELWPLDVKQSVTIVLMEFFRSSHGTRIEALTAQNDVSGIAELLRVEDSFLPIRLVKMINRISMAHTWSFSQMLEKLTRTDSFNGEEFHPRMLAFLLRMGDLCDLDNNRFNRVAIATFGTLKNENLAHYFKHRSVETLFIGTDEIQIIADVKRADIEQECRMEWGISETVGEGRVDEIFQQTIREHINWKSWLEQELRDAKLNVQELFPKSWDFRLPELKYIIRINGQMSVSSNENLKFQFSPEKAYSLIENISIYNDEKFIFVRELIQNAIDASKIQLWRELRANGGAEMAQLSPFEVEEQHPGIFERYRIKIRIRYEEKSEKFYFQIQDSGIGISISDLKKNILTTANSWGKRKEYKEEIRQMPEWLRPTGAFGIGMHTVFSVTEQMKIYTKSDKEAMANEITLHSGKGDGFAFCQKIETTQERGTCFSFSFYLTEEQREQFYPGDESDFLHDDSSEWETVLINEIVKYCHTPLFPVYINEMPVIPGLVCSTRVNELTISEKKNRILTELWENDAYEYAFGYNYEYVVLYDKKHQVVMNIAIGRDDCVEVRFKGMHVDKSLILPDGDWHNLRVDYLDILSGDSEEMIDAARSGLTYRASRQISMVVQQGIAFVGKLYFKLMKAVKGDETVIALRNSMEILAEQYETDKIGEKELWKEMRRLKKDYAGVNDTWQVRSLECRLVTYLFSLHMTDVLLMRQIREIGAADKDNVQKLLLDIRAFHFLDYVLSNWKADWKGTTENFRQDYLNEQLVDVMEHYMVVWGVLCYSFYYRTFTKTKMVADESKLGNLIRENFRKMFPRMSCWKKIRCVEEYALDTILIKVVRRFSLRKTDELYHYLLEPITAHIFTKWSYKAAYSGKTVISLLLSAPYMRLLYDYLDCEILKTEESDKIWEAYVRDMPYGYISCGGETKLILKDILKTKRIQIIEEDMWLENQLLPLNLMKILSVIKKGGEYMFEMVLEKETTYGIVTDEQVRSDVFVSFWKKVEGSSGEMENIYRSIIGFREYEAAVLQKRQYEQELGMMCYYGYVPAWDYLYNIKTYLDDYRCNENRAACIEGIMSATKTEKVISYIAKQKGVAEQQEKVEEIRKCYRQLVSEMIEVWFEKMPRG